MVLNVETGVSAAKEAFFRTALPLLVGSFVVALIVAFMKK